MGWTTHIGSSKESLIKDRLSDKKSKEDEQGQYTTWKTLAHSLRSNNLWYVVERTFHGNGYKRTNRFIALDLIGFDPYGNGWGYKDLCESMGPVQVNCPLKFLDMVPADDPYGWRDGVRNWHDMSNAQRRKLKTIDPQPGEKWMLKDGLNDAYTKEKLHTARIQRISGRNIIATANTGTTYRFRKSQLIRKMGEKEVATLEELLS